MALNIIKYCGLIFDLAFLVGELSKTFQEYYILVCYTLSKTP